MELLAIMIAGFFAPVVVQYVRRVSGATGLKDTMAQAMVLGVSLALALGVALIEGELTRHAHVPGIRFSPRRADRISSGVDVPCRGGD